MPNQPIRALGERPPQRWVVLGLLVGGLFFCYFHRSALSIASPYVIRDLGLNAAWMGMLLSAFFWPYSFAQVPAGWLVDRLGVGRAYAAGFAVWTVAVAATGLASTFALLLGLRLLMGIGQAVAFPASARAVANWFPPNERGGVTGVYLAGNRLGQAAITGIGGAIIATHGWQYLFAWAGIAGVLWLVPWIAFHWRYERTPLSPAVAVSAGVSVKELLESMRDRSIAGIFLGFFAYDYVWLLFISWMPGYLMLERRFAAHEMGAYVSLPYLLTSIVAILTGILSDAVVRRGYDEILVRKWFITAGMLLCCCLIVPAGFIANGRLAALLIGAAVLALSVAAPSTWVLTQAVCGRGRAGTAAGIQNFGGNLGGALAPAITGVVAHATGSFGIAFAIAGAVLVGGVAAYWWLIPSSRTGPR